jgi:hypothetical protein
MLLTYLSASRTNGCDDSCIRKYGIANLIIDWFMLQATRSSMVHVLITSTCTVSGWQIFSLVPPPPDPKTVHPDSPLSCPPAHSPSKISGSEGFIHPSSAFDLYSIMWLVEELEILLNAPYYMLPTASARHSNAAL